MRQVDDLYIGGEFRPATSGDYIDVVSPHSGEVFARVARPSTADADAAIAAAQACLPEYTAMGIEARGQKLEELANAILMKMEEFATTITSQNGSPISWSRLGQVLASTMVMNYYVELSKTYPIEEIRQGVMGPVAVRREPVGVVAGIIPWNVPLFVTALKLAPAVVAGCPVVLKPSPETPLDGLMLAEVWDSLGMPKGSLSVLPADRDLGEYLVSHPGIDKVAFTGSTAAGRKIGAVCGEQLKRVTLELGGKSAAVILDDANLETAIPDLMSASLMNNGQACVAQTRILAPRSRYDEVVGALEAAFATQVVGDPMEETTTIGPLVSARQKERVEGYIEIGKSEGAKVVAGGAKAEGSGWYVTPTLFADVDNTMKIAQEEIFGPVLSVIPYGDVDEAVKIANDSDYGLSGSVYCGDPKRGLEVARSVRTGTYSVNGFMLDFSAPFGGFKASGIGRELGVPGLEAYLEWKSVALPADFPIMGE